MSEEPTTPLSRVSAARRAIALWPVSVFVIVLVATTLRLLASWGDFWLDEIWSWRFAAAATSYWEIATAITHDNNQIVNTWIIYSFPSDSHWMFYRIPAVLAGVGAVILAGLIGLQSSRGESIINLLLTGGSFVLVQYSSEARGYAYLLFFTLLCVWTLHRLLESPRSRKRLPVKSDPLEEQAQRSVRGSTSSHSPPLPIADVALFTVGASLGILSHFLFLPAYAGLWFWFLVVALRNRCTWEVVAIDAIKLNAMPVLVIAGLGLFWQGRMISGGGERFDLGSLVLQAASLVVGGPDSGWQAIVCCCAASIASLCGLWQLIRRGDGFALFAICSTVALILLICIARADVIYPRHFLVPVICAILLTGHFLASLWQYGGVGRGVCLIAITLILTANAIRIWPLVEFGRGGYESAVKHLLAESPSAQPIVASDHDFRNPMVLDYYYRRLKNSKTIAYVRQGQWPPQGPDWIIRHSFDQPPNPKPTETDSVGHKYQLRKVYPYSGLSGWNWMLYQRVD